ncbi:MAG: hypothetical protein ACP5QK_08740 [Myxococcota bacterium]
MNAYMIGPEGRYYFSVDPKVSLYGSASLGLDYLKFSYEDSYVSASGDDKALYIRIGLGGEYQASKEFSAGLAFSYQLNFWDKSNGTFNDYFISVGGRYNIF